MFLKSKRLWEKPSLDTSYEAVIIGGGLHGLATAYYLARNHGLSSVAVMTIFLNILPGLFINLPRRQRVLGMLIYSDTP